VDLHERQTVTFDIAFDVRTDAGGKDPDKYSATLRGYHRQLWSKPLPGGALFALSDSTPNVYLNHRSELGEFRLSSDGMIPHFSSWKRMKPITDLCPEADREAFIAKVYTVGGFIVFPSKQIDGKPTINGARGWNAAIADRFDLTLECIRRHYSDQPSPLAPTLARYADFFALFVDFDGYVSFFLLHDLVTDDGTVKFLMPFDDFNSPPRPRDVEEYKEYRRLSIEFIDARNDRIKQLNL
jgi:hypothetical protein